METTAPNAHQIIQLFNQCFVTSENTRLEYGGDEPVYLPAGAPDNAAQTHSIRFAHGYVSSALHEISHWCIAGKQRRLQVDYGYWYAPDGRSEVQQKAFEQVEVRPQALEWHLAKGCGAAFSVSFDNLHGAGSVDPAGFKSAVALQARAFLQSGLPKRAQILLNSFAESFGSRPQCWQNADFSIELL